MKDIYRGSNPFRSANVRPGANSFVFSHEGSVEQLFHELDHHRQAQIAGPHGTGKSTLMLSLMRLAASRGRAVAHHALGGNMTERMRAGRISERKRGDEVVGAIQREVSNVDFVAVDGFEQLSRSQRASIVRQCLENQTRLLITTHRDMGMPTLYRTRVDFDIARRVVAEICEREGAAKLPDAAHLAQLLRRHGGNLREMLFALYDEFSTASATDA